MSTPLLETKLYIPPVRSGLVSRPRLVERLDEGFQRGCKLILISTPAGFGKTTLLSEWAAQCRRPVAWVSLDESDNDPARSFAYLLAALQRIDPDIGQTAQAMLQAPQPPPLEPLLTSVINDIADTPQSFILVLDDYHVIQAKRIHEALAFLLDHLPPQMHLVLATRADPPLPIARLRGRGQLYELHADDLRFILYEATAFLNEVMELALSAEHVAALERRTEGWIVGLQMAALSMRGRKDVSGFIEAFSGSHRFILDYLVEEVLEQQPGDVREFLLKTSILERMTAPLCDLIMDRDDSQVILAQLEQANLFLFPLDDERHWYRYHHLFADLLRQLLQREARDLVPELHRRASGWYEQNGLVPEAVGHALAAADFERAAYLVEQSAWPMLTRGEMTTMLGWLGVLPDELVRSRPRLAFFCAWGMAYSGELDGVEPCLRGVDVQQIRGEVAAVRAHVAAARGDAPRAIELAQQASKHLAEENLFLRCIVAETLGLAYHWSGNPHAASRVLTEAVRLSRAADHMHLTVTAMAFLGRAQEMQGALGQAIETYRETLELASGPGRRPVPFACMAYCGIANRLYEWNDLDGAMHHATEALALSELGGFMPYQISTLAVLVRVYLARGDVRSAGEIAQKAERLEQQCDYAYVLAMMAEVRTRLWLVLGNLTAASRWAQEHRLSVADQLNAPRELEQVAVARVFMAQGDSGQALELLAQLLEAAEAAGRMPSVIKIRVLQALASQAQGDVDQAISTLERALSLAEPEGFVRTFLDEGEPVARLLRHALTQDIAPNYVARLLAAFGEEVELTPPAMESLIEPLSEREIEVLRLIVAGLSNPEIAEELVIAVSTVKSHTNHIYGKLGVESRTQAVATALELGLL